MSNLKRDNWTNEEILNFLEGREIYTDGLTGEARELHPMHTHALNEIRDLFGSFQIELDSYQALAYDTDTKEIVHVGPMPPR